MNKQRKVVITTTYNEMGMVIDTKAEELAQPNLQPTCNQLATDTISRQAAIDAAELAYVRGMFPTPFIREVPPAQPERESDEWIEASVAGMPALYHEKCNTFVYAPNGKKGFNFCPNCGAEMKGETT